jgi:hypothetical protein
MATRVRFVTFVLGCSIRPAGDGRAPLPPPKLLHSYRNPRAAPYLTVVAVVPAARPGTG